VALLVVGALYWFSLASLRASIEGIYEQRARSVAAVISKSIQEKDYILYYSDELDADIDRLLERYESVVGITVVGLSARGFLVVASTDPALVGTLPGSTDQERYAGLREVSVAPIRIGKTDFLRAEHPIFSGADLIGVVVADMSLDEQAQFITRLSWQFGAASFVGFLLIGGLLYLVMQGIVTKPVGRLAQAMGAVSERRYDVEVTHPFRRVPGTRLVDEVERLSDGFNLMTKVIHSHEQELMKLVVLDELTGAYTRDHLAAELERELSKTRRYKHPTSVLLVDLSEVSSRSPEEQNRVLLSTANFLKSNLRNVDVLFRASPLRFVALLPETPPEGAATAAERLRALLPDVTAAFDFPFALRIAAMGWSEEGAPAIDDVMERIVGPLNDLRE
jgi:GGDEF domain-containing protein